MELKLKRVADNEDATFGVLINGNIPFAVTLEPAWEDNKKGISCIPSGPYSCKRVKSPKFGDTFEILDVEERTHILFHKGNSERNTQGCVLIAEEFGILNGKAAVLASGRGYREFMNILKDVDEFDLIIEDYRCCST